MSESIAETKGQEGEVISVEHLQRLLDDANAGNAERDRQLAEERAERSRLQRERDQLAGHVGSEAERRYVAELSAADGGLSAASADLDRAEEALAAALEAGDHRAAAKAQRAMAEASTRRGAAESKKQWLEQNKQQIVRPPAIERPPSSDPYGELVKDIRPSEREWLKQRSQFLTDERYRQRVYNASGIAEAEGLSRGSDAYLHRIEDILGEAKRDTGGEGAPEPRRPASADVAPTRRAAPGAEPSNGRTLAQLDRSEREIADDMWGTPGIAGYVENADERYLKYAALRDRARANGRL